MQIKRAIDKTPGGMMLVLLFLGALCHTFAPGAGSYFGSFTNGLITGTEPILAIWFFCMAPQFAPMAPAATALVATSVIVTSILVPVITALYSRRVKRGLPATAAIIRG